MSRYENIIIISLLVFPLIAFLITLPYIIHNYHKYGSISFLRTIIIYSFILYLLCAYFMVILPLPTFTEASLLTTPKTQLIPFNFINDFITKSGFVWSDINTYIPAMKTNSFYQPLFNIFLTIPFGIYLHYYFKCGCIKSIIYSFLLSLFFELTQLSGLYFIYPISYRLFDVDDLFFNTLGGLFGYFIGNVFIKILPSRDKIDEVAYEKSKTVSGIRRLVSLLIDYVIITFITILLYISNLKSSYYIIVLCLLYYLIIPFLFNQSTIGEKIVNIKLESSNNNKYHVFFSLFLKSIFLAIIPYFIIYFTIIDYQEEVIIFIMLYFIYGIILFFKIIFSGSFLYEKIFNTHLVSTLKINKE